MTNARPITGKCSKCGGQHEAIVVNGEWCVPPCKKGASVEAIAAATMKRPRSGSDAEALLASKLAEAGYFDTTHKERPRNIEARLCFRREHPWGLALSPERGFRGDVMFLEARLKVEVVGMSHAAKRSNVAGDVTRDGLSATAGIRTLPVSPESVRDGTAVELVKRALALTLPVATGGDRE